MSNEAGTYIEYKRYWKQAEHCYSSPNAFQRCETMQLCVDKVL